MKNSLFLFLFFTSFFVMGQNQREVKVYENNHEGYIALNDETKEFYYSNNKEALRMRIHTYMRLIFNPIFSKGYFEKVNPSLLRLNSKWTDKMMNQNDKAIKVTYEADTTKNRVVLDLQVESIELLPLYQSAEFKQMPYYVVLCSDQATSNGEKENDGELGILLNEGRNELSFADFINSDFKDFTLKIYLNFSNPSVRDLDIQRYYIESEKIQYNRDEKIVININTIDHLFWIGDIENELLFMKSSDVLEFRGEEFRLNTDHVLPESEYNLFE